MPRSVPALALKDVLHWSTRASSPCAANSSDENVRAKWPRSSSIGSELDDQCPGHRSLVKQHELRLLSFPASQEPALAVGHTQALERAVDLEVVVPIQVSRTASRGLSSLQPSPAVGASATSAITASNTTR